MRRDWGVIQYGTIAVDADMVESINRPQNRQTYVKFNSDYMAGCLKERPGAYNDPREPLAVMCHNAQLFLRTKQIKDAVVRREAAFETYEEVCRFMRYYHGLDKKTERD